jgi:UDP-N-acetylglucosamine 2-epimerase
VKIATVVGARPQLVKAAPVSRALREVVGEVLIHTGQHYDDGLSAVFFDELGIPAPDYHLEVGSGRPGRTLACMLERCEEVLLRERPDAVLVYGDTHSTLAGALAAVKLGLPLAHVEAGLRSFNRTMPEEHNRVLTDHCADWLFCPTDTAVRNLAREGLTRGVHRVVDVMADAVACFRRRAVEESRLLQTLGLTERAFVLVTVHRAYNTDDPRRLGAIVEAIVRLGEDGVFPVHPRTRAALVRFGLWERLQAAAPTLRVLEPLGYLDILALQQAARVIVTDSGGIQKEAFILGVPCVTLRPETEWLETVAHGWNVLANADTERILALVRGHRWPSGPTPALFGDGRASERIAAALAGSLEPACAGPG